MGVRGLTLRLKKSAVKQAIGCSGPQCQQSIGVVIDGPSLAYWIHSVLVESLTADGEFQVRPTFESIKEALQVLLEELGKLIAILLSR